MWRLAIVNLAFGITASSDSGADAVLPQLKRSGWTMLIGDSVLQQEFFAIAKAFVADCSPMAMDLSIERINPAAFFQVIAPPEYALICKKHVPLHGDSRCRMLHQNCVSLTVPQPCPDPQTLPFCGHNKHATCSEDTWKKLVDEATAEDVEFALTFHWAPGPGLGRRDPDVGALIQEKPSQADLGLLAQRLAYKHPGAIIMNNCLHSWPYSWGLPNDKWQERLRLFLGALQLNLQELSASSFQGQFGFQACMPLACTEHFAWRFDWGIGQCPAQNSELMAVNTAVRRLFSAMHLRASFFNTWDIGLRDTQNFIDGVHPCFTRPCSWTDAKGSPVPDGTSISNPPVQKYNGLMDVPSSICLNAAERIWGRLKFAKWPAASKKWFNVPIPDVSDLWAEKFINFVPPVSPSVLKALMPKPVIVKPPVELHAVSVDSQAPTATGAPLPAAVTGAPIGGSAGVPMAGTTGVPVGGGTGSPTAVGGTGTPLATGGTGAPTILAGGAVAGTPHPSLAVGTLPPANAGEASKEEHSMPMWMWVLVAFLAMACSSQIWGQTDGQKKSTTKRNTAAFGMLSVVEFESEEIEMEKESQ